MALRDLSRGANKSQNVHFRGKESLIRKGYGWVSGNSQEKLNFTLLKRASRDWRPYSTGRHWGGGSGEGSSHENKGST